MYVVHRKVNVHTKLWLFLFAHFYSFTSLLLPKVYLSKDIHLCRRKLSREKESLSQASQL